MKKLVILLPVLVILSSLLPIYGYGDDKYIVLQGKSYESIYKFKAQNWIHQPAKAKIDDGVCDLTVYYVPDKDPNYDYLLITGTVFSKVKGEKPYGFTYVGPNIDNDHLTFTIINVPGKITKYFPHSIDTVKTSELHVERTINAGVSLNLGATKSLSIGDSEIDITPNGEIHIEGGGSYQYVTKPAQYGCKVNVDDLYTDKGFSLFRLYHEWASGEANADAIATAEQSAYFPFVIVTKIPQVKSSSTKKILISDSYDNAPFIIRGPFNNDKYYPSDMVCKVNGFTQYNNFLGVYEFTLNNQPPVVELKSPKDGNIFVNTNKVTLRWEGNDPDNENYKVKYEVYLGTSKYDLERNTTTTDDEYEVNVKPGNTYYWKVVAIGDHGLRTESPIWSFKVINQGKLYITSNPSDAEIYVDGEYVGNTPKEIELSEGSHTIKLKKDYCKDITDNINIKAGDYVKKHYDLKIDVKITTNPSGAKVYIDDIQKGETPINQYLTPGSHSIKITKEGYKEINEKIYVDYNHREFSFKLNPLQGTLIIENNLEVPIKVYVNGKYFFISSIDSKEITLPPGDYTIKLYATTKYGTNLKDVETVTIKDGKTTKITPPQKWKDTIIKEKEEQQYKQKLYNKIKDVEDKISEYKRKGAVLKEAEELINKAKKELNNGNYNLAEKYVNNAEDLAEKIFNNYKKCKEKIDTIKNKLNEAKLTLNDLKNKGVDISEENKELSNIESTINNAESKMKNGDYDTALSYLNGLDNKIENIIKRAKDKEQKMNEKLEIYNTKKQTILNRINDIKNKYKNNIDLSKVDNLLSTSETLANKGDIDGAISYLDEANNTMNEIIKNFEDKKKEIEKKINLLKEENKKHNHQSVEKLLDEAEQYLNNNELDKAINKYNEAYKEYSNLENTSKIIEQKIKDLKANIDELEDTFKQQKKVDRILKKKYIKELNNIKKDITKLNPNDENINTKLNELNNRLDHLKHNLLKTTKIVVGRNIDEQFAKELKENIVYNMDIKDIGDCVIVGGPVANKICKKYLDYFPVSISNDYPGKHRGVIQKAEIDGYTVILLAGSDRWGTKAAVEYFNHLDDIPDEPIFVEWINGRAVKIERP